MAGTRQRIIFAELRGNDKARGKDTDPNWASLFTRFWRAGVAKSNGCGILEKRR
jgi:hypothetical protein